MDVNGFMLLGDLVLDGHHPGDGGEIVGGSGDGVAVDDDAGGLAHPLLHRLGFLELPEYAVDHPGDDG